MPISTRRSARLSPSSGNSKPGPGGFKQDPSSVSPSPSAGQKQRKQAKRPSRNKAKRADGNEDDHDDEVQRRQQAEYESAILAFSRRGGDETDGASYSDLVAAKRRRNLEHLQRSGLLGAADSFRQEVAGAKAAAASSRGIAASKKRGRSAPPPPRRKSSRLAGVQADGLYVEEERGGRFTFRHDEGATTTTVNGGQVVVRSSGPEFFNARVNDGSDLDVAEAVGLCEDKWITDSSVGAATAFMGRDVPSLIVSPSGSTATTAASSSSVKAVKTEMKSPGSKRVVTPSPMGQKRNAGAGAGAITVKEERDVTLTSLADKVSSLRVDDEDCVAKVTPDRIYAIECHPSPSALVVCAGDKGGYVGIWNVDGYRSRDGDGGGEGDEKKPLSSWVGGTDNGGGGDDDGADGVVHLFRPHGRPVTHLEWNAAGSSLLSVSYDGSVREFDAEKQAFRQVFATYDDSTEFKGRAGYGLDGGRNFWVQYGCLDPRNERCVFLSTSTGSVFHVDLRAGSGGGGGGGGVTLNRTLSEKKINTVSLHPNGTTLAAAGLDTTVKLWDIRKFSSPPKSSKRPSSMPKPLVTLPCGRSVNSAFFSPSGGTLLATTMANNLDLLRDAHLKCSTEGSDTPIPTQFTKKIRHDNMTGRWLSTLMARWHPGASDTSSPSSELFVVGSMGRPRGIDVFDGTAGSLLRTVRGDAMTAVASRCCFHPSEAKLVVCGGNSSGRVTLCRDKLL